MEIKTVEQLLEGYLGIPDTVKMAIPSIEWNKNNKDWWGGEKYVQ